MSQAMSPSFAQVENIVRISLSEDLGSGDVTTDSILKQPYTFKADVTSKENLVFCGVELFKEVFRQIDPQVDVQAFYKDGDYVEKGSTLFTLGGNASSILKGERTALNLTQHLSGISTLTHAFVKAASPVAVLDTRKTHPGLRFFEKYAVSCGGGHNHRMGLYDAVLIKDNHITVAGGVAKAIKLTRKSGDRFIVVETKNLEEVRAAVEESSNRILLDNMTYDDICKTVLIVQGRSEIEVSGSINLKRAEELSKTGIDYISVGALTHSAPWVDISLNLIN